jgi:hypothetical protein
MSSTSRGTQPSTLLDACIDALASGIEHVERLTGISEELALALFDEVIRRGKLNPRVRRHPCGLRCCSARPCCLRKRTSRPGCCLRMAQTWLNPLEASVVPHRSR